MFVLLSIVRPYQDRCCSIEGSVAGSVARCVSEASAAQIVHSQQSFYLFIACQLILVLTSIARQQASQTARVCLTFTHYHTKFCQTPGALELYTSAWCHSIRERA